MIHTVQILLAYRKRLWINAIFDQRHAEREGTSIEVGVLHVFPSQ